jgi:hypothetical protein
VWSRAVLCFPPEIGRVAAKRDGREWDEDVKMDIDLDVVASCSRNFAAYPSTTRESSLCKLYNHHDLLQII